MKIKDELELQKVKGQLRVTLMKQQKDWLAMMSFNDRDDAEKLLSKMLNELDKMIKLTKVLLRDKNLEKPETKELKILLGLKKAVQDEERHPGEGRVSEIMENLFQRVLELEKEEMEIILDELEEEGIKIDKTHIDTKVFGKSYTKEKEEYIKSKKGGFIRISFLDKLFHKN